MSRPIDNEYSDEHVSTGRSLVAGRALTFGGMALLALVLLTMLAFASGASARKAAQAPVPLGNAASFGALSATAMTNAGLDTVVGGDVGSSTSIDAGVTNPGFARYGAGDIQLANAQASLLTAYNNAEAQTPTGDITGVNLAGQSLIPGVYNSTGGILISGPVALTLNGNGDPNAVFIFQAAAAGDLTVDPTSSVTYTNGAQPCNVFWKVQSAFLKNTGSTFVGNILALTQITLTDNIRVEGRLLARNADVTFIHDTVTAPFCAAGPPPPPVTTDVGVVKVATPTTVTVGDNVTYTMVVTNKGATTATGVEFQDPLPDGETLVSATTTQGTCAGTTTILCNIGTLDAGKAATVVIVAKANVAGAISNTGKVVGTNLTANNTSTAVVNVVAATADVGIVKTANAKSVTVGDSVTYTFVVTNYGPGEATGVTLADLLPVGTTFVSVKTTQGSCSGTGTMNCALGTLAPGKVATVVMVVRTTAAGTIPNTAQVVAQQVDQRQPNNTSTATVKASKQAQAAPVKTKGKKAPVKKAPVKKAPVKKATPGAPPKTAVGGFTG